MRIVRHPRMHIHIHTKHPHRDTYSTFAPMQTREVVNVPEKLDDNCRDHVQYSKHHLSYRLNVCHPDQDIDSRRSPSRCVRSCCGCVIGCRVIHAFRRRVILVKVCWLCELLFMRGMLVWTQLLCTCFFLHSKVVQICGSF
jgi:hypothetical protein